MGFLLIANISYSTPSTTISTPNSFSSNTVIQSSDMNSNFSEHQSKYNTHSHVDITQVGTITSGTWNGTIVTTQYGGTSSDFSGVASGAIIYFDGTGTTTTLARPTGTASGAVIYFDFATLTPKWLSPGTNGQFLKTNGNGANPSWAAGGGKVKQVVNTQTGAVATGTTVIPNDNTIPQNTEGDEYMTLAITPTSATNRLKIEVVWNGATSNASASVMAAALFQDSTAGALAAAPQSSTTAGETRSITFIHYMTAGTTSATTFKVRAGIENAGTTTFNGAAGTQMYGGVMASSITISEIEPD